MIKRKEWRGAVKFVTASAYLLSNAQSEAQRETRGTRFASNSYLIRETVVERPSKHSKDYEELSTQMIFSALTKRYPTIRVPLNITHSFVN